MYDTISHWFYYKLGTRNVQNVVVPLAGTRGRRMHDVIEDLLCQMTLQEKVVLLAGTDGWYTAPVERLGIPSLGMTDGPNGAFTVRFFEHGYIRYIRHIGDIGDIGDNGDIGDKCRSTRTPCLGDWNPAWGQVIPPQSAI